MAEINGRLEDCAQLMSGSQRGEVRPLPDSPAKVLTEIISELETEATSFEKSVDPIERDKLKRDKAELLARKCITENRAKILAYLSDLKTAHNCKKAISATDTMAITRRGKSIVSEALTPLLKGAIQSELELLGAAYLPLNLKPSGSKGETLHQLVLKGVRPDRKINLTDVLSEGEQRVVALGGFLAEIGLGQHSCPIILDDPVSSLDHRYRAAIASRLRSRIAETSSLCIYPRMSPSFWTFRKSQENSAGYTSPHKQFSSKTKLQASRMKGCHGMLCR